MAKLVRVSVVVLVACAALWVQGAEQGAEEVAQELAAEVAEEVAAEVAEEVAEQVTEQVVEQAEEEAGEPGPKAANSATKEKLFLANYVTSTDLTISHTTSTVPYTCISALSDTACAGRSARRVFRNRKPLAPLGDLQAARVDSSQLETGGELAADPSGKNFFTVWSVAYSTATITTTVTNTAVTAVVSALCIPGGGAINFPC